jgi:NAD(P)H-dependent FMN reductase
MEHGGNATHFGDPSHGIPEGALAKELREIMNAVEAWVKPDGLLPPREDLTKAAEQLKGMADQYPDHKQKIDDLVVQALALAMRAGHDEYMHEY